MPESLLNRQWLLRRRPTGPVSPDDFTLSRQTASAIEPLKAGQLRVRYRAFLCAPTIRNALGEANANLITSIGIGEVVRGPALGQVVATTDDRYPVGMRLSLGGSWQDYETIDLAARPVERVPDEMSDAEALGLFGPNSLTAYFGVARVGQLVEGETMVVSGAAGSTGSIAAQLGKIRGSRVVGIAGGSEKCRWLTNECGLDAAIDYKAEDVGARLRALCPSGIDVFFDNVGGAVLQAGVDNMARHGRIVLCGQISTYDSASSVDGLRNMMRLIYGSVRMQGFLRRDYQSETSAALADLVPLVRSGRIKARVDVRAGFEQLPQIFTDLFYGRNNGTLLCLVDE
jgi:NADPH-dependent curcumin reductase CurA